MWYLAEILFAESKEDGRTIYQCESCNVVFQAASAVEAHEKALEWAVRYADEPPAAMELLGVAHLTTIGEALSDGTEICGRLFESLDVWEVRGELIPPPEELKAIKWEAGKDTPVRDLLGS